MNVKNFIRSAKKLFKEESSVEEQVSEVIKKAEWFDRLTAEPGWEEIVRHMASEVNGELLEAAGKKYDREGRLMHCDMWHAKRELLDSAIAYIESMQRERDRIIGERGVFNGRNQFDA